MFGQKKIRVAKTKYFDIIFPEKSAESAQIIFENADRLYLELKDELKIENDFRTPVVLSPSQEVFNAYMSCAPFNHIVIYDTPPEEDSAFFSEELLNTFRHELIHDMTFNARSKALFRFAKIFGDTWNPALLTTTMGIDEGASVSLESEKGEGRLNNDFHTNLVKQAKIQGKFPKFSEIQGARDEYPNGLASYYFGGAFSEFIQKKYGMEKYAELWYRWVNFKNLTYFGAFKKVYGISMKDAWQDFYDSIEIPEVQKNPSEESFVLDVQAKSNRKNSRIVDIASDGKTIAVYDSNRSAVKILYGKGYSKEKTLFYWPSVTDLKMSSDGRFLGVSWTKDSYNQKSKVFLYDFLTKKKFVLKETGGREIIAFNAGNKTYAALIQTFSQTSKLKIYLLNFSGNRSNDALEKNHIKSVSLVYQKTFKAGTGIFSPAVSENGTVFYILKEGMEYSIVGLNGFSLQNNLAYQNDSALQKAAAINDDSIFQKKSAFQSDSNFGKEAAIQYFTETRYSLPDNMIIQGLSFVHENFPDDETRLSFSYTIPGQTPRLGALRINGSSAQLGLTQKDVAGSVLNPVYAGEKRFAFISSFFDGKRIHLIDSSLIKSVSKKVLVNENIISEDETEEKENLDSDSTSILGNSKRFNLPVYMTFKSRGTIFPFGLANTYAINSSGNSLNSRILPVGIIYATSSPWTMPILGFSGGWNYTTNSAAIMAFIYGGSYTTDFFKYEIQGDGEFDSKGFKQTQGQISITSEIPLYGLWNLSISQNTQVLYGRMNLDLSDKGIFQILDKTTDYKFLYEHNKTQIGFDNLHKSGNGHFDTSGVSFSAFYDQKFIRRTNINEMTFSDYQNIGLEADFYSSFLRPWTIQASLYPSDGYIGLLYGNLMLFDIEIQKSTNFLPLFYFNRLKMNIYYAAKFATEDKLSFDSWAIFHSKKHFEDIFSGRFDYYDQAAITASFYATPNLGGLARSTFQFSLNGALIYRFNPESDQKQFVLSCYANIGSLKF